MSVGYHPHGDTRPVFEPHNGIADGPRSGWPCFRLSFSASARRRHWRRSRRAITADASRRARYASPTRSIRVDGRLDDDAWRSVPPVTDFVQKEPVEGAPPSDRMEVRFAYDDGALYVGARMYSSAPIQAPMGRRDEGEQAEHLLVSLDTYLDRRTSSTFGVTATGVRLDHYHASDDEFNDDDTFDPVWQARDADRRAGVDRRAVDSVLAAAVQRSQSAGLGAERAAMGAVAQRGGVLGARAAHRGAVGLALRRPARHRRHPAQPPPRDPALRREPIAPDRRSRSGRSVQRRRQPGRGASAPT